MAKFGTCPGGRAHKNGLAKRRGLFLSELSIVAPELTCPVPICSGTGGSIGSHQKSCGRGGDRRILGGATQPGRKQRF
jgi:hypothetical protein